MSTEIHTKALGQHLIIDYFRCGNNHVLSDPMMVEDIIKNAAAKMNATIVMSNFHHFSPLGVSGVLVIAESHITIHTWPEHDYVAMDIFYCGQLDIAAGLAYLDEVLAPQSTRKTQLHRGDLNEL